jgi:hypothetical protein
MPGRIRTVKPEFEDADRVAKLSDGAYRLFGGIRALADDRGNCPGDPTYLARVFYGKPRSLVAIGKLVDELEVARLVDRYTADGELYVAIIGWGDRKAATYQRIDKPQEPKYPLPTSVRSWNGRGALDDASRNGRVALDYGSDPKGSDTNRREREPARAIPPSADQAPPPAAAQPDSRAGFAEKLGESAKTPVASAQPAAAVSTATAEARQDESKAPMTTPPGESAWHRRMRWWGAMLEADARIRAAGIEPNAPTLPKAPAGENERNLNLCERQLVDGGFTPVEVDAKMRHIVLVAEAEALRSDNRSRLWFKPSCIWDPARAARAVDTSLEEASRPRSRHGAQSPATPPATPPARRAPTPQPAPVIPAEDRAGHAELAEALKRLGIAAPRVDEDADAPREAPS